jgi:hypothetical protein
MTGERQRFRIFYEDQSGSVSPFPLHRLVLAAAHDHCPDRLARWALDHRVIAIPKKGQSNVLEEVGRTRRHLDAGVCVIAWLDTDHVRDLFPKASRAARAEVIDLVKQRAGAIDPGRLEVFLLDQNLESLLEALERELRDQVGEELTTRAIRKKRLDARDQLLLHVASGRELRRLLRARHQGFDCLTRAVRAAHSLSAVTTFSIASLASPNSIRVTGL